MVLIIGPLLLLSCEDSTSADDALGEEMTGDKIYAQKCVSCHGKKGDLGVSGAADLSKSTLTLEEKIEIIKQGGPNGVMQAYGDKYGGSLNEELVQKVAEYVESLSE